MNFADENGYLEIVIYVILMVAGLAASAYRNFMKKKEEQQKVPQEDMPDFPESVFDAGYESEESPEEETYIESSVAVDYQEPEEMEKEPELLISEQKSVNEKISSESQTVFESTKDEIIADNFLESQRMEDINSLEYNYNKDSEAIEEIDDIEGFDLRKAIIYSEIMKPKYL